MSVKHTQETRKAKNAKPDLKRFFHERPVWFAILKTFPQLHWQVSSIEKKKEKKKKSTDYTTGIPPN